MTEPINRSLVDELAQPTLWRSLEEKRGESPQVESSGKEAPDVQLGRRQFLSLSGATAAVLGLGGCIRRPEEKILPFSKGAEYLVPGVPLHFASTLPHHGDAIGVVVTSHDGRPTKIEGNPRHPTSQGGIDAQAQAAILDLYDPDRSRYPLAAPLAVPGGGLFVADATDTPKHVRVEMADVERALQRQLKAHAKDEGLGLRILSGPVSSPSFVRLRDEVLKRFPKAKFHTYASVSDRNALEGAKIGFARAVRPVNRYDRADVVLALDSDFLVTEPGAVRAARDFASRRKPSSPRDRMSRLYCVEATFSVTGANADERLRLPSGEIGRFLLLLAKVLSDRHGVELGELASLVEKVSSDGIDPEWVRAVAHDLAGHRGRGLVVVGMRQPAHVHALVFVLNRLLGNEGPVVGYVPTMDPVPADPVSELAELVQDMQQGRVQTLLILGGNPVYDAPSDLDVAGAFASRGTVSFHLSSHFDETSRQSTWHIPRLHPLECWADHQSMDGTISIQQPLIAPLFGGQSDLELLARLAGSQETTYGQVRTTLRGLFGAAGAFEARWRSALHTGVAIDAPEPLVGMALRLPAIQGAWSKAERRKHPLSKSNLEAIFVSDRKLVDGQYANNAWLLELPDPLTKICWDNAALLSPKTARELGVNNGYKVRISGGRDKQRIELPVWVLPGLADWTVTLPLGWGRRAAGKYGEGVGFDVHPLRTAKGFDVVDGIQVSPLGGAHDFVQTQTHHSMEGRPIAIDATLDQYRSDPIFAARQSIEMEPSPLWKEVDYSEGHKWGMSIDLSACTGCNACVVACQAENNIATVGKDQVRRGREMAWIRVDRYFVGEEEDDPAVAMQPVTCQHCEEAPCENVCPVNATAHSPEGLNDMAYNRCVGTRYCANNCPYKVRRFNYLSYHDDHDPHGKIPETKKMQFNPNVTVRMRGVMEKCTYCVQRIQQTKITAKRESRAIRDGEITPACAQTCPSQAIRFGDLNDPASKVSRLASQDRGYKLLAEIGTQPRTTFLGKIRNPSPLLEAARAKRKEVSR